MTIGEYWSLVAGGKVFEEAAQLIEGSIHARMDSEQSKFRLEETQARAGGAQGSQLLQSMHLV